MVSYISPISVYNNVTYFMRIYICAWTAFSFYVIIGFIAIMLIVLLLDRFLVMCVTAKIVWLTETLAILFVLLIFFSKCT